MGCYWNCQCYFKVDQQNMDKIIAWTKQHANGYNIAFDKLQSQLCVLYSDHSSYSFGQEFEDLMSDVAKEYELDGEMFIRTDEDDGLPPWKTTFENGKAIHWKGEIIYTRLEE